MNAKTIFLVIIFFYSHFIIYSQNSINSENFIPPGTIKINDSLFIDRTPITNFMYNEFEMGVSLGWNLQTKDSIKKMPSYGIDLKKLGDFPNTVVNPNFYNKIKSNKTDTINNKILSYFYHPKYCSNPVINVSKENAELFCLWRTDMVELGLASKSKTIEERNNFPAKVTYRLVSNEELLIAEEFFKKKKQLKIINKNDFTKMIFDDLKKKFYIVNLNETTITEEKDNANSKEPTVFRCICEISK